jgi:hypothetical protein
MIWTGTKIYLIILLVCLFAACKEKSDKFNRHTRIDKPELSPIEDNQAPVLKELLACKPAKFILKGSECAGFQFISPNIVLWTNEIICTQPDTLKMQWIDDSTFFTRNTISINENCPPDVSIYKLVSFDGRRLILKDIWTGWNNYKDETLEFIKDK